MQHLTPEDTALVSEALSDWAEDLDYRATLPDYDPEDAEALIAKRDLATLLNTRLHDEITKAINGTSADLPWNTSAGLKRKATVAEALLAYDRTGSRQLPSVRKSVPRAFLNAVDELTNTLRASLN